MADKAAAETLEAYKGLLESTKREIIRALPKAESHAWKLVLLVLPIILTSIFGLYVSTRVERVSTDLQAQLTLTQDYYRERLKTYKLVHEQVVALREKAKTAADQTAYDAGLDKPIGDFYSSYSNSSIFITDDLLHDLTDLWNKAMGATRADKVGTNEIHQLDVAIDTIEKRMRQDLHVK
jgi:hypothetical protein